MEKPNKLVMVVFMLMPLFTSLISISHVTVFLSVSNSSNMAIILSIAYETGMLVALSCMFFLHRLEKATVYFIFVLLFILQLIGNIYYSFYYITEQLKTNKQYLDTVTEFIVQIANLFDSKPSVSNIKMIIAIIIGFIVPVVSMSFLRLLTKYIKSFEKPNIEENNEKTEEKKKSPISDWTVSDLSGLIKKYKEKNNSAKEEAQATNEEKPKPSEPDIEIKIEEKDDLESQPIEAINIALEKSQSVVDESLLKINDDTPSTTVFHPLK